MIRLPLVRHQGRREPQVETLHECNGIANCCPAVAIDAGQHLLAVRIVEWFNGFTQVFEKRVGLNVIVLSPKLESSP